MGVAATDLPCALDRVLAKGNTTGKEVARTLGVAEQTVSRWRTGRKPVNPELLHELARRTPGAAPEELDAAHVCSAGVLARYDCGDYQDHPMAHLALAAKEDDDEDRCRSGIDLILAMRRERVSETELARLRRYVLELAQEVDAKYKLLAALCAWLGDSLTDTMRAARSRR